MLRKIFIGHAVYFGLGVVYLIVNEILLSREAASGAVNPDANDHLFHGYWGHESEPLYMAEAIGTWPVALVYGLVKGHPLPSTHNTSAGEPEP